MKRIIVLCLTVILLTSILLGCSSEHLNTNNETSTILAASEISNADTVDDYLSKKELELKRAEKYKNLLKSKYNESITDYSQFYNNIEYDTENALNSIENYCLYLENEYNSNVDFFDNYTIIKYQSSSASAIWKAKKEYELAKEYADKLQLLYEEL